MDNLDDSETNAKISDSGYSNSCSNSQSRRSRSSKSTHSGSNSSGSSGYGGKPSTSGSSNILSLPLKKDKDSKKRKSSQAEAKAVEATAAEEVSRPAAPEPIFVTPHQEPNNVVESTPALSLPENVAENMDISTSDISNISSTKEETVSADPPGNKPVDFVTSRPAPLFSSEGFSCVISMHDGVVMYTTATLTTTLGFPKDMWSGRSFIDFIHPRDRNTFASQITNGLAVPKVGNGTKEKANAPSSGSTMVCRIRRYRGLSSGFGVRDRVVTFMPFLLKFTFKNINEGDGRVIYLVIQATPYFSAFKIPNEMIQKPTPFVIRHAANGLLEYIDPESVPYLGYLPQDIQDKDALQLYHPEDLPYLKEVYESIVKDGGVSRSKPYRMVTQNGDCVKLETEWSSFINPWSMKLEFVIGKHHILEGPANPDVFQSPPVDTDREKSKVSEEEKTAIRTNKDEILRVMNEVLTKPAEVAKQQMSKRRQDLSLFMETLLEESPKLDEELRLDIQDPDNSCFERDSVMLGGISHHDYDSKSSIETTLSYNQLNYNVNLQRYFDSMQALHCDEEFNVFVEDNALAFNEFERHYPTTCMSPLALQHSMDSHEITLTDVSALLAVTDAIPSRPSGEYLHVKLTEAWLIKHNVEMEKELVKVHRESRSNKLDREKASNQTRQKKKEHLARCNASFQPTMAGSPMLLENALQKQVQGQSHVPLVQTPAQPPAQAQGQKRASKQQDTDPNAYKRHCGSPRLTRRPRPASSVAPVASTSTTPTTTPNQWPSNSAGTNMNAYISCVGIPQQIPLLAPVPTMPGMTVPAMPAMPGLAVPGIFPMYYQTPDHQNTSSSAASQFQAPLPCMMYGQPMYGLPIVYSPMNPQVSYPMHQTLIHYTNSKNTLGLTNSNYEENAEHLPETSTSHDGKSKNTEETVDRTDGDSSYSSFNSSFFKTDSGSAEESGDQKKKNAEAKNVSAKEAGRSSFLVPPAKNVARRKMQAPWKEQVCFTSDLIYKYQIRPKPVDEVLEADKQKIEDMPQPTLVNEQLGQLYIDLQLEGVTARLTLEDGITSSSSSGEDSSTNVVKSKRKREYSKLMMIYEEDAPMPPPAALEIEADNNPSISTN